jgi:hypothetical protein
VVGDGEAARRLGDGWGRRGWGVVAAELGLWLDWLDQIFFLDGEESTGSLIPDVMVMDILG